MSQKIRRALAVAAVLSALSLALPAPVHAAALWHWQPANVASRFWSWLQELGLVPQAEKPARNEEKQGSMVDPDGLTSTPPPPSSSSDQGSMVDPDGRK
jgi:hypothetical protein